MVVSFGGIAQLVRARASHARGRGFEPLCLHQTTSIGVIAQLVARLNGIQKVRGSTPLSSTTIQVVAAWFFFFKADNYSSITQNLNIPLMLDIK